MSKEKSIPADSFLQGLFQAGLYKSSQGRIARQVTFAVMLITVVLASWRIHETLKVSPSVRGVLNWAGNLLFAPDQQVLTWSSADSQEVAQAQRRFQEFVDRGYRGTFEPILGEAALELPPGGYRHPPWVRNLIAFGVPFLGLAIGGWVSYRLVNMPRFADFLVAVEAEMNKVTWPSRAELIRSSIVVIFVIFALAIILFGYDMFWKAVFTWTGIVR